MLSTVLDVEDPHQAIAAVEAGVARFGKIDVVVNNAGISLVGAVEETSAEDVERLGPDTLQRMAEKNTLVERETEAWRTLAASTNH